VLVDAEDGGACFGEEDGGCGAVAEVVVVGGAAARADYDGYFVEEVCVGSGWV
jgi:hypothetical protein